MSQSRVSTHTAKPFQSTEDVAFSICLPHISQVFPILVPPHRTLAWVFENGLKGTSPVARRIQIRRSFSECGFYRLEEPVVGGRDAVAACADQRKWIAVDPLETRVRDLAPGETLTATRVYLTVDVPQSIDDGPRQDERWRREDVDDDDMSLFRAYDVQKILRQIGYDLKCSFGGPCLALITSNAGNKHGVLKFVERENEVRILKYLGEIQSPMNHTISGTKSWPVRGGYVIFMPVAGKWLTSLKDPERHMWSLSLQLVKAVAFMHEHNVAHMDLKPQNILIPSNGGRLSIIDFSASIHVPGPDQIYHKVIGTKEYIAPEVRRGAYKPMLADLWSCGKTLETLCLCCSPSEERASLLEVSGKLMKENPEQRPKMATVLKWMTSRANF